MQHDDNDGDAPRFDVTWMKWPIAYISKCSSTLQSSYKWDDKKVFDTGSFVIKVFFWVYPHI